MKKTEIIKELRGFTLTQLSSKIKEAKEKIIALEQDKALGKLKNLCEITKARKYVAYIKTIMSEKALKEAIKETKK